ALALAGDGWSVALSVREPADEHAHEVVREIEAKGGRAVVLQADLGDIEATAALVPDAAKALGPLTLLVNNASEFKPDEADSVTEASWREHMDVNLRAPAFLSRAFAAQLPDGAEVNIVNIIDQRVWAPTPRFFSYTISKMALWDMTQVLARSLAPAIRVNGIGPVPALANTRQSAADFRSEERR